MRETDPLVQDGGDRPTDTGWGRQTHCYWMRETDPLLLDEGDRPTDTGWGRQTH